MKEVSRLASYRDIFNKKDEVRFSRALFPANHISFSH